MNRSLVCGLALLYVLVANGGSLADQSMGCKILNATLPPCQSPFPGNGPSYTCRFGPSPPAAFNKGETVTATINSFSWNSWSDSSLVLIGPSQESTSPKTAANGISTSKVISNNVPNGVFSAIVSVKNANSTPGSGVGNVWGSGSVKFSCK
jgi:hypothetical protein